MISREEVGAVVLAALETVWDNVYPDACVTDKPPDEYVVFILDGYSRVLSSDNEDKIAEQEIEVNILSRNFLDNNQKIRQTRKALIGAGLDNVTFLTQFYEPNSGKRHLVITATISIDLGVE